MFNWGMRRGLEDAHRTTAQEVRSLNPAVSTSSFSLGTDKFESTYERPKSEE